MQFIGPPKKGSEGVNRGRWVGKVLSNYLGFPFRADSPTWVVREKGLIEFWFLHLAKKSRQFKAIGPKMLTFVFCCTASWFVWVRSKFSLVGGSTGSPSTREFGTIFHTILHEFVGVFLSFNQETSACLLTHTHLVPEVWGKKSNFVAPICWAS